MRQRIPVTPVPERPPDVEAFFSFNDVRKSPARDGYRPAHRLTDTCLTTGVHYYYDVGSVPPGASARGTITFLSPEAYPHCLWVGKRIPMQEGAHVVGYAVITRIDNRDVAMVFLNSTGRYSRIGDAVRMRSIVENSPRLALL